MIVRRTLLVAGSLLLGTVGAIAAGPMGAANVVDVEVTAEPGGTFRFDVTIRSDDTGWEAYADAFEIVGPDGAVLGTRVLYHPHVDEQPFTRSLAGVAIPPTVATVIVRARHSRDGHDGQTMAVALPR